jgi:hypothetical protein
LAKNPRRIEGVGPDRVVEKYDDETLYDVKLSRIAYFPPDAPPAKAASFSPELRHVMKGKLINALGDAVSEAIEVNANNVESPLDQKILDPEEIMKDKPRTNLFSVKGHKK